jgi:signal transduction histidine kinase
VIAVLSGSTRTLRHRAVELARLNERLHVEMEERQRAEEALRASQKLEAIGQLSGGIAHDFNNLIMIAKGNLSILKSRLNVSSANVLQYLTGTEAALQRAANLTQRILAFSRQQALVPRPVQLSQLVRDMDDLIRHSITETIRLETDLRSHWWTSCDMNQMENVILNLAINARDAMPEGGVLCIATRDCHTNERPQDIDIMAGDYVSLSIRDNGAGMAKDVLQHAVDPFFTTKPLGKGTGLGLSMAFGFVKQSKGDMRIESEQNVGTTVTIYMPRINGPA